MSRAPLLPPLLSPAGVQIYLKGFPLFRRCAGATCAGIATIARHLRLACAFESTHRHSETLRGCSLNTAARDLRALRAFESTRDLCIQRGRCSSCMLRRSWLLLERGGKACAARLCLRIKCGVAHTRCFTRAAAASIATAVAIGRVARSLRAIPIAAAAAIIATAVAISRVASPAACVVPIAAAAASIATAVTISRVAPLAACVVCHRSSFNRHRLCY